MSSNLDEKKFERILKEIFDIDEINLNHSMDDIPEWDSFKHILLLTKIEKEFKIKLQMNDFTEMISIPIIKSKIVKYLNEK
tara:strand:+ start:165 stop:407 length:243 start_codon:yes stop_codon:yes gene_type:complete